MKRMVELSRYLVLVAVGLSLLAAVAALGWGAQKTFGVIAQLLRGDTAGPAMAVAFIQVMDAFLIAAGLLIFAYGMHSVFVGDLEMPGGLKLHTLHDLKARLGSIIILVMTVAFLEHLMDWHEARDTLLFALAISLVAGVLIASSVLGERE